MEIGLADILYVVQLPDPGAVVDVVRTYYQTTGWAGVTDPELDDIIRQAFAVMLDPPLDGRPANWQWDYGFYCAVLVHAREHRPSLSVVELAHALQTGAHLHQWRMAHLGQDRFAGPRGRWMECVGRLLQDCKIKPWEQVLLGDLGQGQARRALKSRRVNDHP